MNKEELIQTDWFRSMGELSYAILWNSIADLKSHVYFFKYLREAADRVIDNRCVDNIMDCAVVAFTDMHNTLISEDTRPLAYLYYQNKNCEEYK